MNPVNIRILVGLESSLWLEALREALIVREAFRLEGLPYGYDYPGNYTLKGN